MRTWFFVTLRYYISQHHKIKIILYLKMNFSLLILWFFPFKIILSMPNTMHVNHFSLLVKIVRGEWLLLFDLVLIWWIVNKILCQKMKNGAVDWSFCKSFCRCYISIYLYSSENHGELIFLYWVKKL